MSQFILCIGNSDYCSEIEGIEIHYLTPDDVFLDGIAHKIVPNCDKETPWYISACNADFDTLFIDAQHALSTGKDLSDIPLGEFFNIAAQNKTEIYLWYANDWDDLDIISDQKAFFESVEKCLTESSCEAYIYYKPEQN